MPRATCPFCAIIEGRSQAEIVFADDTAIAFLDVRPVFPGHVLVVPREHHETLVDLPATTLAPLFADVQRIAKVVETTLGADGTFVAMNNRVSQSVPHLHVHVVPRRKKDGLRGFFWPRSKYAEGDMEKIAAALREALKHP
jgi:histidine triad (HIT) family protein